MQFGMAQGIESCSLACVLLNMCIIKFLNIRSLLFIMQVPGNLIVSARSASHSFDSSQMNMSHVISHFSFGKKITPRVMSDLKRLLPHLGGSHDRLNGLSYISNPSDSNANVTVSYSLFFFYCIVLPQSFQI